MAFDRVTLQKDISAKLGGEFVPLEIGADGWNAAFRRTLEVYSRYKPLIRHISYKTPVTGMYQNIFAPEVQGLKVVEVIPGIAPGLSSGLAIESAMLSGQPIYYGVGDTFIDIQYYDLRRRWIKAVSRELGSDPDYATVVDPETNLVSLYTYGSQELYIHTEAVIPHKDDLTSIPIHSQNWIAEWLTTEVKMTIGNARSKFDKIPVAGTDMRLNGKQLKDEAELEQKKLLEWIQGARTDLVPFWC